MDWSTTRELQDIDYFTSLEMDRIKTCVKEIKEPVKEPVKEIADIHLTLSQMREARLRSLSKKTIQDVNSK